MRPKTKKHVVDPHNEKAIMFLAYTYMGQLKEIHDGRSVHRRGNIQQAMISFIKLCQLMDHKSLTKVKHHIETSFDEAYKIIEEYKALNGDKHGGRED